MDYTLIRSRRKTVAIRILPGGRIEVRAPLRLAKKDIDFLLAQKSDWIAKKKAAAPPLPSPLRDGSKLPYLGTFYPICLNPGVDGLTDGKIALPLPPDSPEADIRKAAECFYRSQAKILLPLLVSMYAEKLGVCCRGIRITNAKGRWGSCSSRATVNFSWRLLAAPREQIELVVAHELCHIRQFNHSLDFYHTLAGIFPDWKEREKELRLYRQLCW